MPFPNHPPPTNVAAMAPAPVRGFQATVPGQSFIPGPVMLNNTGTTNAALVPGGSYMNGN